MEVLNFILAMQSDGSPVRPEDKIKNHGIIILAGLASVLCAHVLGVPFFLGLLVSPSIVALVLLLALNTNSFSVEAFLERRKLKFLSSETEDGRGTVVKVCQNCPIGSQVFTFLRSTTRELSFEWMFIVF